MPVRLILFFFIRRRASLTKQHLGAKQANTFRTRREYAFRFVSQGDIRQQFHAFSVAADACHPDKRFQPPGNARDFVLFHVAPLLGTGIRRDDQHVITRVNQQRGTRRHRRVRHA